MAQLCAPKPAPHPSPLLQAMLPQPDLEEASQLSWPGAPAIAAARLGVFRLQQMPLPWRLMWPAHDRLSGAGDGLAWGQPRARLASPASLAQRALGGGCAAAAPGGTARAEWILAFAGQFWRPWRPLAAPGREAFLAWSVPRTTCVVWHFLVRGGDDEPAGSSSSNSSSSHAGGRDLRCGPGPGSGTGRVHLRMVLRARSQDADARRAFARYMRLAGPASRALRRRLLWALASSCGMPPC